MTDAKRACKRRPGARLRPLRSSARGAPRPPLRPS